MPHARTRVRTTHTHMRMLVHMCLKGCSFWTSTNTGLGTKLIHCYLASTGLGTKLIHCYLASTGFGTKLIHCYLASTGLGTKLIHCYLASTGFGHKTHPLLPSQHWFGHKTHPLLPSQCHTTNSGFFGSHNYEELNAQPLSRTWMIHTCTHSPLTPTPMPIHKTYICPPQCPYT